MVNPHVARSKSSHFSFCGSISMFDNSFYIYSMNHTVNLLSHFNPFFPQNLFHTLPILLIFFIETEDFAPNFKMLYVNKVRFYHCVLISFERKFVKQTGGTACEGFFL